VLGSFRGSDPDEPELATETDEAAAWDRHAGHVLAAAATLVVGTATIVYHFIEGWSWVDSLYFSVVAVTTVGFGDLTPTKDISKLFTVFYLLSGIAIVGLYIDHRLQMRSRRIARLRARHRGEAD